MRKPVSSSRCSKIPGPVLGGILTGQAKDMFTFTTGREHFELAPSIGVGIPDVFGVFLSAGIIFDADLTMGYDTAGLIKFVNDPLHKPEDLLHGFYFDNSIDTSAPPIPNVMSPRKTAFYLQGFAQLSAPQSSHSQAVSTRTYRSSW